MAKTEYCSKLVSKKFAHFIGKLYIKIVTEPSKIHFSVKPLVLGSNINIVKMSPKYIT
jgi:hypothetical protein